MYDMIRCQHIERIISEGRISRKDLLERLNEALEAEGISTIKKGQLDVDIKFMRDRYSSRIISHTGINPGYEYAPNSPRIFTAHLLRMERDEQHELDFALSVMQSKADLPLLRQGLETINRIVGHQIERLGGNQVMVESSLPGAQGSEFIPELYMYIKNRVPVTIQYQKLGEARPSPRTISPYLLREYRGFWYMVGYNHGHEKGKAPVIVLALDRVKGVGIAHVTYFRDPDFDPASYFRNSIGIFHEYNAMPMQVRFWASARISHFIEVKKIHHSQRYVKAMKVEGKEGGLYQMEVCYSDEVAHLFLERGDQLKALGPDILIKAIKAKLKAINAHYRK